MKTIILTIQTPIGQIEVVNENSTCLGDAILKTRELHQDFRLRHIVDVETIDYGNNIAKFAFANSDISRLERIALIENYIAYAQTLLQC